MKNVIFKYAIPFGGHPKVPMPKGAVIRSVQAQADTVLHNTRLVAWALVDELAPLVHRCFRIAGTGHPLTIDETKAPHLSTVQQGRYVRHILDMGEVNDIES